jgi:hypothetical protein
MTLCPIALAVGCQKCPIVSVCPVKTTLGDFKKDDPSAKPASAGDKKPKKS